MTQNDELIPSSTSSHSCEIWIRSQIRLYSSPSPMGMLWLKLKESRNFSSRRTKAELGWNFQPLPKNLATCFKSQLKRNQVEGTSVSPESVWHCGEELQIRIDKYCCGQERGIKKIRIIYLLTNSCNSINTIREKRKRQKGTKKGREEGGREINERIILFPSRSWHFSEQNIATLEISIQTATLYI